MGQQNPVNAPKLNTDRESVVRLLRPDIRSRVGRLDAKSYFARCCFANKGFALGFSPGVDNVAGVFAKRARYKGLGRLFHGSRAKIVARRAITRRISRIESSIDMSRFEPWSQ